jgi:hypothetical protein
VTSPLRQERLALIQAVGEDHKRLATLHAEVSALWAKERAVQQKMQRRIRRLGEIEKKLIKDGALL